MSIKYPCVAHYQLLWTSWSVTSATR